MAKRRPLAWVALAAVIVGSMACLARQPIVGQEVSGLDRKLSTFAYIEEGDLITLIVDTRAARYREGSNYLPLEVAVGNRGLRKLTLTRESFTLIDANGNRYPLAGVQELIEGYEHLDLDRNLGELSGIVFNKFGAFQRYDSSFSPTRAQPRLTLDNVGLPKFGYLIDFLYFPAPEGGVRDQSFELFMNAPELEDPVFVKFAVR